MKKFFLIITLLLAAFTAYQFIGRTNMKTTVVQYARARETIQTLSQKKVDTDYKIEVLKDRMHPKPEPMNKSLDNKGYYNTKTEEELNAERKPQRDELVRLTAERDALAQQMKDQDAKAAQEEKAAEEKIKTENLRLILSFLGTVMGGLVTIIVTYINRKK